MQPILEYELDWDDQKAEFWFRSEKWYESSPNSMNCIARNKTFHSFVVNLSENTNTEVYIERMDKVIQTAVDTYNGALKLLYSAGKTSPENIKQIQNYFNILLKSIQLYCPSAYVEVQGKMVGWRRILFTRIDEIKDIILEEIPEHLISISICPPFCTPSKAYQFIFSSTYEYNIKNMISNLAKVYKTVEEAFMVYPLAATSYIYDEYSKLYSYFKEIGAKMQNGEPIPSNPYDLYKSKIKEQYESTNKEDIIPGDIMEGFNNEIKFRL